MTDRRMHVRVLGCGGSQGVPTILGNWGRCDPTDPRNRRQRTSILIEVEEGPRILVDASPDLRAQCLDMGGLDHLDAIVFTHAHADHCHGIDDLRPITRRRDGPLPIYADPKTLEQLHKRFGYGFVEISGPRPYGPWLAGNAFDGPFEIGGLPIIPFKQVHGRFRSMGFRFGPMAYSTDLNLLPEQAFEVLAGVHTWLVDCQTDRPHPTHSHVDQTLAWIRRVRPERSVLIHMDETLDYAALDRLCPPGVVPAHDGMVFDVPLDVRAVDEAPGLSQKVDAAQG